MCSTHYGHGDSLPFKRLTGEEKKRIAFSVENIAASVILETSGIICCQEKIYPEFISPLVISRRVEVLMHVKYVEAQTSSHWCGVEVRTGVPAQVSSYSLDQGSKLRSPSPKVLV
ncbi:hypothetical protein TNCV_3719191 [Trichonephila clavipes]|nr:hypothetical protein TNCV_3719191 [Trichonephila clavipes]